jgi:hypothetical protein
VRVEVWLAIAATFSRIPPFLLRVAQAGFVHQHCSRDRARSTESSRITAAEATSVSSIRPNADDKRGLSPAGYTPLQGFEYGRRQFVTFSAEELKALDVESSKVIDIETFVPRAEIDPIYFDTPYHLYPDGPIAVVALRMIGAAMAEAGVVGMGRLTLSRRERMVMVEPRGSGMTLFTLRAAEEVRAAQFGSAEGDLDVEMVAITRAISDSAPGHSTRAGTATAIKRHYGS